MAGEKDRTAGGILSMWKIRHIEEVDVRHEQGGVGVGGRLRAKVIIGRIQKRQSGANDFLPPLDRRESGCTRRRLHVRCCGGRIIEDNTKRRCVSGTMSWCAGGSSAQMDGRRTRDESIVKKFTDKRC